MKKNGSGTAVFSTKVKKVKRIPFRTYDWKPTNPKGLFREIDVSELFVDLSYQRDARRNASRDRIEKMSQDWSWVACHVLIVMDRWLGLSPGEKISPDENRYYIVDGQHRHLAASLRSDIRTLPCMVFPSDGVEHEAAFFAHLNRDRKNNMAYQYWKSEKTAGDRTANMVYDMVSASGYRLADATTTGARSEKSGHVVVCVEALWKAVSRDHELATRVWGLCADLARGQRIKARLFSGLFEAERVLNRQGDTLMSDKNLKKLRKSGPDLIEEYAEKTAKFLEITGKAGWAKGVIHLLNKGRHNRIHVED